MANGFVAPPPDRDRNKGLKFHSLGRGLEFLEFSVYFRFLAGLPKYLLRVHDTAETEGGRAIHAGRHQQKLAVLI